MLKLKFVTMLAGAMLLCGSAAAADEIKVIASNGIKAVFNDFGPTFERQTGHRVMGKFGATNLLAKEIEQGEPVDVAILTPAAVAALMKQGKLVDGSSVTIARVGLGVVVKQGAPKPDISSVAAFKDMLVKAKTVSYTTAGQSGLHLQSLLEKLGIAEAVKAKSKTLPSGDVAEFVARGESEVAIQLVPEVRAVHGTDYVGPLPAEIQSYIVLSAALGHRAKDNVAARALIQALTSPETITIIKAKGMEPG